MNKLELQKMAVEVRKGIVTGVHSANQATRAAPCQQQTFLLIFSLKN